MYVLDTKLHNDQNITIQDHSEPLGQFIGFSNDNDLLVANERKF